MNNFWENVVKMIFIFFSTLALALFSVFISDVSKDTAVIIGTIFMLWAFDRMEVWK